MAKPKIDFKQLLLEKGEKYGLIAGGALMVLLIVWGIIAATKSVDTEGRAKELGEGAKTIKNRIATGPAGDVPQLESWVLKPVVYPPIDSKKHMNGPYFVDSGLDSLKRGNPVIYGPTEFQVDLIRDPIFVYGFTRALKNGQDVIEQIYVGREAKKGTNTKMDTAGKYKGRARPAKSGPMGGGGPMGGIGGGPMGGIGGPMGGIGGPMGGFGGGLMGGIGGGFPGAPGAGGSGGASQEVTRELVLVPIEEYLKNNGKYTPAQFIRPMRAIVVTASFPWKQQLTEYQKQLRFNTLADLMNSAGDQPQFKGFKVKRRITAPDGKVGAWEDFDWLDKYEPIFVEKILEDHQDPPELAAVIPPEETRLCIPLPKLVRGDYPKPDPAKLPSIERTLTAIKNSKDTNHFVPGGNKLDGGGDPFFRGAAGASKPKSGETNKGSETSTQKPQDAQEAFLMRFIDVDIRPGYGYEYQVQIRATNPNFGQRDKVSTPKQAEEKELESEPVTVTFKSPGNDKATVTRVSEERYAYAAVNIEKNDTTKPDNVRLQVHDWMEFVRTDRSRTNAYEPIGDWIVEDVQVPRGQFVIATKFVKVPVWSPTKNAFVYMEFGKISKPVSPASKDKGTLALDLAAPQLLVDFEGGPIRATVARNRFVSDDSGTEVLLLGEDGKLRARAAWADVADPVRVERERDWTKWQKETKEAGSEKPTDKNPFDRGGPGGSIK
jgi:hypothetical protein